MRKRPVKPTVKKNKGASQAPNIGKITPVFPKAMVKELRQ